MNLPSPALCLRAFILALAVWLLSPALGHAAGTGLTGRYFNDPRFLGFSVTRTDPAIDFSWAESAPHEAILPDSYGVRWTGRLEPAFNETYTLHLTATCGVRLWIDGRLIIARAFEDPEARALEHSVTLTAGQRYNLTLEAVHTNTPASVTLEWSSPSQPRQVIPTSQLYPDVTPSDTGSVLEEFWFNLSGTNLATLTTNANFPLRPSGREVLVSFESLAPNWTNQLGTRVLATFHAPSNGLYQFAVSGSEVVQLSFATNSGSTNLAVIASAPAATPQKVYTNFPSQISTAFPLTAHTTYAIELLQKSGTGAAHYAVAWKAPWATNFSVIPGRYLAPSGLRTPVPSTNDIFNTLATARPRLMTSPQRFAWIKQRIAAGSPAYVTNAWRNVSNNAVGMLGDPPTTNGDIRGDMLTLGIAYHVTGNTNFAEQAWKSMNWHATQSSWYYGQELSQGDVGVGMAWGYDWFYNYLTPARRALMTNALVQNGLIDIGAYYPGRWFMQPTANNWSYVLNLGWSSCALALGEEVEALSESSLVKAISSVRPVMGHYDTDAGGYHEGLMYHDYGVVHNVRMLAGFQTALGTCFGLDDIPGLDLVGVFHMRNNGPTGQGFDFSDAYTGSTGGSLGMWLSRRYHLLTAAWYRRARSTTGGEQELLWYDDRGAAPSSTGFAPDVTFRGPTATTSPVFNPCDVITLRSKWDDNQASFVGFRAADTGASHGALDAGTFVFDALNRRWALDTGIDNGTYNVLDGHSLWWYYGKRAEGHNTLVINPPAGGEPDQKLNAVPALIAHDSQPDGDASFAIADLTPVYTNTTRVWRGVKLFNQRSTLLVQDEITLPAPGEVYWFMHFDSNGQSYGLSTNKTECMFTNGSNRVWAKILTPGSQFYVTNATPFPWTPNPTNQANYPTRRKLAIRMTNVSDTTLAVLLVPLLPGDTTPQTLPSITPLTGWPGLTNAANQPPTLAPAAFATAPGGTVDINLRALGLDLETSTHLLRYTVSNGSTGTVTLLTNGYTARFTAPASFPTGTTFTVTTRDQAPDPRLLFHYNFEAPGWSNNTVVPDIAARFRDGAVATTGGGVYSNATTVPPVLAPFTSRSVRLHNTNTAGARLSRGITSSEVDLGNESWTVAGWFRRETTNTVDTVFYAGTGDTSGGSGEELELLCPQNSNQLLLRTYNSGGTLVSTYAASNLPRTNWHHAAVTFSRTGNGTGQVRLYVNGTAAGGASNVTWNPVQSQPLRFGGHADTINSVDRWFDGQLDDIALFEGALSSNEVAQLASGTVLHLGGRTTTNTLTVFPTALAPVVTALASTPAASESGPVSGVVTLFRSGPTNTTLTAGVTLGGTASPADYTISATHLTFLPGQTNAALTLTPVDDAYFDPAETITVTVAPDADYVVGSPAAATVTVSDNDPSRLVTLTAPLPDASEDGPVSGRFTLAVSPAPASNLTVNLAYSGTAAPGGDYLALPASVVFVPGQTSTNLDVIPVPDATPEIARTVIAALAPGADYSWGSPESATVTLAADNAHHVFTNTTTGTPLPWSVAAHWSNGFPPVTSPLTRLTFQPAAPLTIGTLTASNDLASPFVLNQLTFAGNLSGATLQLTGGTLTFTNLGSDQPRLDLFATASNGAPGVVVRQGITLAESLVVTGNGSAPVTLAGPVSGPGHLDKQGTGTLILTGTNTYAGATWIRNGTLQIGNGTSAGSLGLGSVNIDSRLVFHRTGSLTVTNALLGTGAVYQTGPGTTTLDALIGYDGSTHITNGTLALAPGRTFASSAALVLGGRGRLDLGGNTQDFYNVDFSTSVGAVDTVTLTNGALRIRGSGTWYLGIFDTNYSLTVDASGLALFDFERVDSLLIQGEVYNGPGQVSRLILGATNLIAANSLAVGNTTGGDPATGTGTLDLGQTNSFSIDGLSLGATARARGLIQFRTNGLTGVPVVTFRGKTTADLRVTSVIASDQWGGGGTSWGTLDFSRGYVDARFGDVTLGRITANGRTGRGDIVLGTNGGVLDITQLLLADASGAASGTATGSVVQAAGNVFVDTLVMGRNNSSNAAINIRAAYLLNGGTLAAGTLTADGIPATNTSRILQFNSGTLTHRDTNTDLTASGTPDENGALRVILGTSSNHTLHAEAGRTLHFASDVVFSGSGPLVQTGPGTLRIDTTNTFAGPTTVSEGTFLLNGAWHTGLVLVANGATLGGTGFFAGPVSVAGTHAPGATPGTQTVAGLLTYAASSRLQWQLTGNATNALPDLVLAGTVRITNGAALDVNLNAPGSAVQFTNAFWGAAQSWTILESTNLIGALTLGTVTPDAAGQPASTYGVFSITNNGASVLLTWAPSAPVVSLIAASNGSESGPTNAVFTFQRVGATNTALTLLYSVSGTATPGDDYPVPSGSLLLPAGASTVDLTLTPADDSAFEGPETIIVTLLAGAGYDLGAPVSTNVTLLDNDPQPTVNVTASDPTAAERGSDTGAFTVTLIPSHTNTVTVPLALAGTASPGTDYAALSASVVFAPGQTTTTLVFTVSADSENEGPETVSLTVLPGTPYAVGSNFNATVTIEDSPRVSIAATAPLASESGPSNGVFTVTRAGSVLGVLTVPYQVGGSATPASDYTTLPGSVSFTNGQSSATVIVVPQSDGTPEPAESVQLALSTSVDYTLATPTNATVWIGAPDAVAVFTNTLTGVSLPWNTAGNWLGSLTPASGSNATVQFFPGLTLEPGTVTTSNNLASPFVMNQLLLDGVALPGATSTVVLAGGALSFVTNAGLAPTLTLAATSGLGATRYTLATPVQLAAQLTVTGDATASVTGNVSGPGGLTKSGASHLTLAASNTYTGPTRLDAGTLALAHPNALPASNAVTWSGNAALTLGGHAVTLAALNLTNADWTGTVSNGALALLPLADLNIRPLPSGSNTLTQLDASGLTSFTFHSPIRTVSVGVSVFASNRMDWSLASGSNTFVASSLNLALAGNGNWPFNGATVRLGQTNTFHLGNGTGWAIRLGGYRSSSNVITFLPGLTNPVVHLRASNGIDRAGGIVVSEGSSGTGGGQTLVGSLDLGIADVRAGLVTLGRTVQIGTGVRSEGYASLAGGTLDVTTLLLGEVSGPGTNMASINGGTLVGQFTQSGGLLLASNLHFGSVTGVSFIGGAPVGTMPSFQSAYHLLGGTLSTANLFAQSGTNLFQTNSTRVLHFTAGTLANYNDGTTTNDLLLSGSPGTGGLLEIRLISASNHILHADAQRTITVTTQAVFTGAGPLTKSGPGTLRLLSPSLSTGLFTLAAGTLELNSSLAAPVTTATGTVLTGTGIVAGACTVLGDLRPGSTTPGTLTISGPASLAASARLPWRLTAHTATAPGTNHDHIAAAAVTLTPGATLDVVFNAPGSVVAFTNTFWQQPRAWTVLASTSLTGTLTLGSVSLDAEGGTFAGLGTFSLAHTPGGVQLIWTPVGSTPPFVDWQTTWFGGTNGSAAPGADPDGDGSVNLLEYAFGMNPLLPGISGLPTSGLDSTLLWLDYTRLLSATDITYRAEGSSNLIDWWTNGITLQMITNTGPTEVIRASVPVTNGPAQFLRVRVTRP